MRTSSRLFAVALAERLNEVVPAGCRLSADGDRVELYIEDALDSIMFTTDVVDDQDRDLEERLHTAVYAVMNSVQDSVSEHLTTAWPSRNGRTMAMPGVRVGADAIFLWYGENENEPVVRIPRISFAEVTSES